MTNCPTCGSPVKVVGNVTKHYEPYDPEKERLRECLKEITIEARNNTSESNALWNCLAIAEKALSETGGEDEIN